MSNSEKKKKKRQIILFYEFVTYGTVLFRTAPFGNKGQYSTVLCLGSVYEKTITTVLSRVPYRTTITK